LTQSRFPSRGEVWLADLDPVVGHEQGGTRPVLVISEDRFNHTTRRLAVVLPLTTRLLNLALRVRIAPPEGGVRVTSDILCDQVRTASHARLRTRWGVVDPKVLAAVEEQLVRLLIQDLE
jgi:mRNA interferase MazF